jgi:hypothetical protein
MVTDASSLHLMQESRTAKGVTVGRLETATRRGLACPSGDTVEMKRAVQRFSAIKMRSLNDPRQSSLPTALLHLDRAQTDASATIRPPIPTPAQRVSDI